MLDLLLFKKENVQLYFHEIYSRISQTFLKQNENHFLRENLVMFEEEFWLTQKQNE